MHAFKRRLKRTILLECRSWAREEKRTEIEWELEISMWRDEKRKKEQRKASIFALFWLLIFLCDIQSHYTMCIQLCCLKKRSGNWVLWRSKLEGGSRVKPGCLILIPVTHCHLNSSLCSSISYILNLLGCSVWSVLCAWFITNIVQM